MWFLIWIFALNNLIYKFSIRVQIVSQIQLKPYTCIKICHTHEKNKKLVSWEMAQLSNQLSYKPRKITYLFKQSIFFHSFGFFLWIGRIRWWRRRRRVWRGRWWARGGVWRRWRGRRRWTSRWSPLLSLLFLLFFLLRFFL